MRILYFIQRMVVPGIFLAGSLLSEKAWSQSILDQYIREGLENNLVLRQRNLSLQQAQESMQMARSSFLPSASLLGNYSTGDGGRTISIPAGDLLNPIYTKLNELNGTHPLAPINNMEQNFIPNNFFDAKIRISQPIVNTELNLNRAIGQQQVKLTEYDLEIYKRQLIFEIKSAYFTLLSLMKSVSTYKNALVLTERQVSINASLLRNGKILPANCILAQNESEQVRSALNNAGNLVTNAKMYFNFLLNRKLDSGINTDYPPVIQASPADTLSTLTSEESRPDHSISASPAGRPAQNVQTSFANRMEGMINDREELAALRAKLQIARYTLKKDKQFRLPVINGILDLGSQASDWQFNNKAFYYQAGIQFSLPLYEGARNKRRIRRTTLSIQQTEMEMANTAANLELAARKAENDLQTSRVNYQAAQEQVKSAQTYYRVVERGYQEGAYSFLEWMHARNQLTAAELREDQRRFDILIASARLERETASYHLPPLHHQ